MAVASLETALGHVRITCDAGCVTSVRWGRGAPAEQAAPAEPLLKEALAQMQAYFAGALEAFDLPLRVEGSAFQKQVCEAMLRIPFGHTKTYGDLARTCDAPAQAIGSACGGNPIPIIIPCHRVLGANSLGGFSGGQGIEDKVWLLRHEGAAGLLI